MRLKPYLKGLLFAYFFSALAFASVTEIHQHKAKKIGANTPIPKIELTAYRDMMDGVNIHVEVANYLLGAPDLAPKILDLAILDPTTLDPTKGILAGHAHVFINGIKRQRLYGSDLHIPQAWLKKGVNQIAISLNSHQHENWVYQEQNIVGSIFLDLAKKDLVLHNFTSQPLEKNHPHH